MCKNYILIYDFGIFNFGFWNFDFMILDFGKKNLVFIFSESFFF